MAAMMTKDALLPTAGAEIPTPSTPPNSPYYFYYYYYCAASNEERLLCFPLSTTHPQSQPASHNKDRWYWQKRATRYRLILCTTGLWLNWGRSMDTNTRWWWWWWQPFPPHYHIIAITIDSERVMVSKSVNKIMVITISITFPSNATESYLPLLLLLLLLLRGHLFFFCCPTEYWILSPPQYRVLKDILYIPA